MTTIIYTNWRRAAQLQGIVGRAIDQTAHPQVHVIDNASGTRHAYQGKAHKMIHADNSLKCWARWVEAMQVDTRYVCIMDDDLTFTRPTVIEECETYMDEHKGVQCIGAFGVLLPKGRRYWESRHTKAKHDTTVAVQVVKGRFMFIRRDALDGLGMEPDLTCDDIKVSAHLWDKRLPGFLHRAFKDLVEGQEALHADPVQRMRRNEAAAKYFPDAKRT